MSEPEKKKRKTKRRNLRINTEAPIVRRNISTTAKIPQQGFKQSCFFCVKKKRSTLIDIANDKNKMEALIKEHGIYNIYLLVLKDCNMKIRQNHPNAEMYYDYKSRLEDDVVITGRYVRARGKSVPICGICYNRSVKKNPQFKALNPRVGGTKKRRKRKKKRRKKKRKTRKKN